VAILGISELFLTRKEEPWIGSATKIENPKKYK
jgi:hypothetical protein